MNSKPVTGFSCGKCCYVYDNQEKADKCCEEKICSGCGARIGKNFGDYYEPYAYKCDNSNMVYVPDADHKWVLEKE